SLTGIRDRLHHLLVTAGWAAGMNQSILVRAWLADGEDAVVDALAARRTRLDASSAHPGAKLDLLRVESLTTGCGSLPGRRTRRHLCWGRTSALSRYTGQLLLDVCAIALICLAPALGS